MCKVAAERLATNQGARKSLMPTRKESTCRKRRNSNVTWQAVSPRPATGPPTARQKSSTVLSFRRGIAPCLQVLADSLSEYARLVGEQSRTECECLVL